MKINFTSSPAGYPGNKITEYPLWGYHKLCPSARYVGGTSKYLCECKVPRECEGVQQAVKNFYSGQIDE